MRLPEFIGTPLNHFGVTYSHLEGDEWAIMTLSLVVATGEADVRSLRRAGLPELFLWHDQVAQNLDPEGDLRTEPPPPWKAAVSYARSVMESVCDIVAARAESADELIELPDLLRLIEGRFGDHFFTAHLEDCFNPPRIQETFQRFLWGELRTFQEEQALSAWQKYRERLNQDFQSGRGDSGDVTRKSAERSSVVSPILKDKNWTPNKWASKAGVGKNCPYEYLAGTRVLTKASRRALAEVLGLTPDQLPND